MGLRVFFSGVEGLVWYDMGQHSMVWLGSQFTFIVSSMTCFAGIPTSQLLLLLLLAHAMHQQCTGEDETPSSICIFTS